jgi:deoxyribodipyrimidine photo-lyase
LDQLVTWRELGLNFCSRRPDYDRYESLPEWARSTLDEHAADERPVIYSRGQLEGAQTHDAVWNAAQRQLLVEGRIQSYLRMLWGKKILEWSASPRDALETMLELNNKYALDGRDPSSYSGIFWCLGRYDRPWAPKRPIFGSIRFMSSASAQRKLKLREYLKHWNATANEGRPSAAG